MNKGIVFVCAMLSCLCATATPAVNKPKKEPAGSSSVLDRSNFSPLPIRRAPFNTVTFSSLGCQCGGTL